MSSSSSSVRLLRSSSSSSSVDGRPRRRSSAASSVGKRRPGGLGIPRAAHWGWGHLPLSAKVLVVGVFAGLVAAMTPFWAFVSTDVYGTATFGLWHYCIDNHCTSIHDNLVSGRHVPAWWHMTQGNLCIGVALSIVGLAMVTNSIEGRKMRMTVTVHRAAACVLGISSLEHFVALYIFANYIEETDFLYDREQMSCYVDFYGSYYMGVISFLCSVVAGLVVFCDDSISRVPKKPRAAEVGRGEEAEEEFAAYEKWCENNAYNNYYGDSEEFNDFTLYNGQQLCVPPSPGHQPPPSYYDPSSQMNVVDEMYYSSVGGGDVYSTYYDCAYVAARSDIVNQPIIEEVPEYQ